MGTDEDQVAVAPGALRRTWTEGGRRYFHYATDAPIGNEWAFFSADYAVHEATVERRRDPGLPSPGAHRAPGPHDPKRAGLAGLLHRAVRSLSVPPPQRRRASRRPGTGMHAEASMITYGQGVPFWNPKDEREPRFPVRGGGARDGAPVDASRTHSSRAPPFLSESLAWYSAMQVVKDVTRARAASAAPELHAAALSVPRRSAAVNRCSGRSTRTCPTARDPSRCTR